ncbi:hypothetical protein L1277_003058 [Okibacterium sp. HSC-33S16]|uniref:hypothetical protein n=1 Tax=Okibacterium sp. HSC-33S16 TaxID=2910965 RepID=UPI00209EABDF|nr:hypothetical protein [Okibacterium sp. HSC-33S16]MCP2032945.1 hypothetical protein [Okibacterium sp. HSC-33S16]
MPNRFQRTDPPTVPTVPGAAMAALLDSVDGAERKLYTEQAQAEPVSPGGHAFAQVLDDLTANLDTASPVLPPLYRRRPAAPAPLSAPGDLVLVIGAPVDALAVVRSMAAASDAVEIAVAGTVENTGAPRVDDRRTAVRARAMGVQNSSPVFVAYGLDRGPSPAPGWADTVGSISPDQVWVAIDAGRKPDDTAAWVNTVAALIPVDAVAVEGSAFTTSPETVEQLNLPIGWVDGRTARPAPAQRPVWDS